MKMDVFQRFEYELSRAVDTVVDIDRNNTPLGDMPAHADFMDFESELITEIRVNKVIGDDNKVNKYIDEIVNFIDQEKWNRGFV